VVPLLTKIFPESIIVVLTTNSLPIRLVSVANATQNTGEAEMNVNIETLAKLIEETILRNLFDGDEDYRGDAKSVAADVIAKMEV
jgi:hypothetical protein